MIFPGMDPWVEHPAYWPGFHHGLATFVADALNRQIRPRYYARLDVRIYSQGPDGRQFIPDLVVKRIGRRGGGSAAAQLATATRLTKPVRVTVPTEITEAVVRIHAAGDRRLVTWIEILSPTNKYAGEGRNQYQAKQREILASPAHLVEIDLLRGGPHALAIPEWATRTEQPFDSLICVNRAIGPRDEFELYPITLRKPLPILGIPLGTDDDDAALDLQEVVAQAYSAGAFAEDIDYSKPCEPRLSAKDRAWANGILKAAGLK